MSTSPVMNFSIKISSLWHAKSTRAAEERAKSRLVLILRRGLASCLNAAHLEPAAFSSQNMSFFAPSAELAVRH